MKPESDLDYTLALLAAKHRAERPPRDIERAVLAEFDAVRPRRIWKIAAAAGAIAALLVAGAFSIHRPKDTSRPARARVTASAAPPALEPVKIQSLRLHRHRPRHPVSSPSLEPEPFIAIPYTVPLAPEERATVVRMTLSPAAIAAVGFPFQPEVPQQADVLISEDGRARAIRIVASSDFR